MYAKIALGNVRKSFRDFSVFFLTLAVGVCVFYAFGSITDRRPSSTWPRTSAVWCRPSPTS